MLKINLGCGPHALHGWVNYDLEAHPNVMRLDLSKGKLPHADASAHYVWSEHFIEHLTLPQAFSLMCEVHRVLKPDGVIRISTPDLANLVKDYQDKVIDRFKGTWDPATPCDMVNEGMRLWGHQYVYDFDRLSMMFRTIGFTEVIRGEYNASDHKPFEWLEVRPYRNDLIIEATK